MSRLVSVITPTYARPAFLATAQRWVAHQTYPTLEWLILDDSPEPTRPPVARPDIPVRYEHVGERLSIGEKRNRLIERAQGDTIVHLDDDDYYAPRFIEAMVGILDAQGADFANLSSWYLYDLRHELFGFWDLRRTTGLHYLCYANRLVLGQFTAENNAALADNYLGFGFTYVYRRRVWEANRYADVNWGEDIQFVRAAAPRFRLASVADASGLVLHILHPQSSSSCFPQYHLPEFLVPVLMPPFAAEFEALRHSAKAAVR